MDKTLIEFKEETHEIALKCSDNLWKYIQELRQKGLDNISIVHVAQIYKEVKNLNLSFEDVTPIAPDGVKGKGEKGNGT